MAFNIQRRTSDIANVVVADASRNVTLPADLTVTALVNAGLLKGNAAGKLVAAVAGTDFQSPISLTTTGSSGAATFVGGTLNIPQYTLAGLGGLANPMTTLGDIIYGGASGAATRLSGNTTTAKQFLSSTGNGSAAAAPAWSAIAGSDVTGAALTKTDDTNVTLTLGGTPATSLLRAASLTLGWTGTLAVSRGGTGAGTLTGVVVGNGTSAMTAVASTTALQVFRVNAAGTGYEFASISTGGGTVTSVSVVSANGFAGTVATAASTPAITLTTTVTGLLKGNGTAISAAVAGTDYLAPFGSQTANTFYAAPNGSAGAPSFRAIVAADIPTLNQNTTGSAGSVQNNFIIRADSGSTEGTDIYTFNGSAAKNLNIIAGSLITITKAAGSWTIATTATANTGTVTSVALATGTSGTDVNVTGSPITSSGTITLNIPDASSTARGLITTGTQTIVGQKTLYSGTTVFDSNQSSTLIEGRAGGTLYGGIFFGAFVQFNAYTSASSGFLWKNGSSTNIMTLDQSGNLGVNTLAGTGTRMVVANSTGVLSTQAITTGTVTSVALATGSTGTDINVSGSPITSSGTITLNIPTASGSARGLLSSADWTTFNSKQSALTNPVTGTGASGQVAYFNGTTTVTGNNNFFWDITNSRLGIGINTPVQKLHVYGTTNSRVGVEGTTNYSAFQNINTSGNIYWGIDNSTGSDFTGVAYARFIYSEGAYPLITYVNGAERMRIASTGAATFSSTIASGGDITAPYDTTDKLIGIRFSATYYNGFVLNGTTRSTGIVSRSGDASDYIWFGTNAATERMRITNGGNLLVGTTTDSGTYKLDVNGASVVRGFLVTTDAIKLGANSSAPASTDAFIYRPADNTLAFGTASTERLRIDVNGNIGVGVTPSAWGAGFKVLQLSTRSSISETSGYTYLNNNAYNDGSNKYLTTAAASQYIQGIGEHYWNIAASGTAGTAISFTQAMTLNASGNLIVGGTSVYGATITSYASATRSGGIGIRNSAGTIAGFFGTYAAGSGSGSTDILAESAGFMAFSSGGSERMRITSGGNLLVGTTTDTGDKFQVAGNAKVGLGAATNSATLMVNSLSGSAAGLQLFQDANESWIMQVPASSTALTFGNSGTERMRIASDGNVGIGTASPDARLRVVGAYNGLHAIFGFTDGRGLAISTSIVAGTNEAGSVLNARGAGAGTVIFQTDGTERMRVNYDGNVGIGTTSPNYPLQVRRAGGAGSLGISIDAVGSTDRAVQYFAIQDSAAGVGAGHAFYYRGPSSTTDTLGLILDEGGNVGIGTTSPSSKLVISNGGASGLEIDPIGGISSGVLLQAYNRSTSAYMAQSYYALSHTFNVGTGGATRAVDITSGGNLLVGTTTDSGERLFVSGNAKLSNAAPYLSLTGTQVGGKEYRIYSAYTSVSDLEIRNITDSNSILRFLPTGEATFTSDITWGSSAGKFMYAGGAGHRVIYSDSTTNNFYSGGTNGFRVINQADTAVLMQVTNGGNILIGSTTDNGTDKLQVNGSARFNISTYQTQIASTGILFNGQRGGQNYSSAIYAHSFDNASNNYIYAGSRPANTALNAVVHYVGTDNQVYWDTTNASYYWLTSGTTKMLLTSGGNVGIGTTSPTSRLSVSGTFDGLTVDSTGVTINTTLGSSTTNNLKNTGLLVTPTLSVANSNVSYAYGVKISPIHSGVYTTSFGYGLYVDALSVSSGTLTNNYSAVFMGGNVGIGADRPISKLHMIATGGGFLHEKTSNQQFYGTGFNGNDAYLTYYTANNFILGYGSTTGGVPSVNTLVLTTSGNVGIGTTGPKTRAHISGSINSSSLATLGNANNSSAFLISNTDTDYGMLFGVLSNGSGWIQQQRVDTNATAYPLVIQPNGGNLLVGTTTDAGYKLDVTGQFRATLGITETRIDPRSITTTSTATLTPDVSADDFFTVTAQAATITIANPTGTPVDGQKIIVRIKDNGSARTIQYGNQFRGSTDLALPTTTTVTKTIYLGFVYNSADTKWDIIAKNDGF